MPPHVAQTPAVPVQVGGQPFFATINHFQQNPGFSAEMRIETVQSLGVHYANSLWSHDVTLGWATVPGWRDYNLNSRFTTLTGTVLRRDGMGTRAGTISFFGDGRELLTITTVESNQPQPISVDLRGVNILRIQISCNRTAFTNAMIY